MIELRQTRDVIQLLGATFSLWRRHFGVFFTLALIVVAPVLLLIQGVWTGTLDDFGAPIGLAPEIVSIAVSWVLQPALVTAMHVVAVMDAGRGVTPRIARSLRVALRMFVPVAFVLAMYALACLVGYVALLIPGVYLSVRLYFGPQAVLAEDLRGRAALARSWKLVGGQWWRAFGIAVLAVAITFAFGLPLLVAGELFAALDADTGPFVAVAQIVWEALAVSFTALISTLFFFDLRHRASSGEAPSGAVDGPQQARSGV